MSTPELLKREVEIFMPDGSSVIAPSNVPPAEIKARWELGKLEAEFGAKKSQMIEAYKAAPFEQRRIDPEMEQYLGQLEGQIQEQKSLLAKYKADRGSMLDKAGYHAKQIGSAALRGLTTTAALAASGDKVMRTGKDPAAPLRDNNQIGLSPVTRNERTADTIIQAATGGLLGAPKQALLKTVGMNAGIGAGIDAGYRLGGDENPLAGLSGGTAALVAALAPSYFKVSKETLAREVADSASEEAFLKAQAAQREIANTGMSNVNLSQVMPENSAVDKLIQALAVSPQGKQVQAQLQQQPKDVSFAAEDVLASVKGDVRSPQQIANLEQEAATQAQKQVKQKAGGKFTDILPEDLSVPPEAAQNMIKELQAFKATLTPSEANLVEHVISKLQPKTVQGTDDLSLKEIFSKKSPLKVQEAAEAVPVPLTDANAIDKELKFALEGYGPNVLSTPGLDANLNRIAEKVRDIVEPTTAPKLAASKAAYQEVMEKEMNPLKQSIGGRMAGKAGYKEGVEASRSKLMQALDRGVDPLSKNSEILEAQKALSKVEGGNEIFRDSVKTWLSGKISAASKASEGRLPEDVAKNFESFFGNPANPSHASQGMKDTFVALARSEGLPDDSLLKGVKHAQMLFSAAARRPRTVGAISKKLEDLADTNIQGAAGTDAMKINFIARKIKDWQYSEALKFFDDLVTTPEGVDTLLELSKNKNLSPRAYKTLAAFMALQASEQEKVLPPPIKEE